MWWSNAEDRTHTPKQQEEPGAGGHTNYSRGQKILLRDTDPRFNSDATNTLEGPAAANNRETFKHVWSSISLDDFKPERLLAIPCFREAGMMGLSAMAVVTAITTVYHRRTPAKIFNWSVGGLLLGSVVGWEQCRMRRQKSFEIAQIAIQTVKNKPKPMMNREKRAPSKKELIDEWNKHPNDVTKNNDNKKWYKFW